MMPQETVKIILHKQVYDQLTRALERLADIEPTITNRELVKKVVQNKTMQEWRGAATDED